MNIKCRSFDGQFINHVLRSLNSQSRSSDFRWLRGAMVARLTPDQKVASSILVGVIEFLDFFSSTTCSFYISILVNFVSISRNISYLENLTFFFGKISEMLPIVLLPVRRLNVSGIQPEAGPANRRHKIWNLNTHKKPVKIVTKCGFCKHKNTKFLQ